MLCLCLDYRSEIQSGSHPDLTRPTCPSSSRTLIPCEWNELLVKRSLTTPWVSLPLRWSFLRTIITAIPGVISSRCCPFIDSFFASFFACFQLFCFRSSNRSFLHRFLAVLPLACCSCSLSFKPMLRIHNLASYTTIGRREWLL